MKKRCLYSLFVAIMLVAVIMLAELSALAASPTYSMSADYKRGRYYDNFRAVDLCGDGVRDTLAIALSQLGYHEGNDNSGRDGLSADGDRDFVEYNVLYGKLDNNQGNGVSYGYYWCASFVNWCLRQAEVSREASAAAEVSCRRWLSACQSAGICHEKEGYIPQSADIIFFKERDSQVTSTHIGLVLYCEGDTVYTIEGNTSNGSAFSANGNYVALKSYKLSSSYIVGYATPKYNRVEEIGEIDYSGKNFYSGKYITTDELKIYSDNTFNNEIGRIAAFTVFEVERVEGNTLYVDGGAIKAESVRQITSKNNICSVSYLDSRGKKIYDNSYAKTGDTVTVTGEIPERSDAAFLGWTTAGSDVLISPDDELVLDDDIELYAIYDDTKFPIEEVTRPKTEECTTGAITTSEAYSEQISTETEELFSTEEVTEHVTEHVTEQVSDVTESKQDSPTPTPALPDMLNCSGSLSASAIVAISLSIATAGITFKKKTYKKDKK